MFCRQCDDSRLAEKLFLGGEVMSSQARQKELVITYDDQISRWFLMATLLWGVVGMLVGVIVAVQLAYWPANLNTSWLTFGRLRPLHTNAVVFAFAANGFFVWRCS